MRFFWTLRGLLNRYIIRFSIVIRIIRRTILHKQSGIFVCLQVFWHVKHFKQIKRLKDNTNARAPIMYYVGFQNLI